MRTTRSVLAAGLVAIAAGVAACGGSDGEPSAGGSEEGATQGAPKAPTLDAAQKAKGEVTFCSGKDNSGAYADAVKRFNAKYGGHAFNVRTAGKRDGSYQAFYEQREKLLPWITEYSPMSHVTKDDPPVFLEYNGQKKPPVKGEAQDDPTHSALLGLMLMEKLKAEGVDGVIVYPGHPDAKYKANADFLIDRLTAKKAS